MTPKFAEFQILKCISEGKNLLRYISSSRITTVQTAQGTTTAWISVVDLNGDMNAFPDHEAEMNAVASKWLEEAVQPTRDAMPKWGQRHYKYGENFCPPLRWLGLSPARCPDQMEPQKEWGTWTGGQTSSHPGASPSWYFCGGAATAQRKAEMGAKPAVSYHDPSHRKFWRREGHGPTCRGGITGDLSSEEEMGGRSRPTPESEQDKQRRDQEWENHMAQFRGNTNAPTTPSPPSTEEWVQDVHGVWFQVSGPLPGGGGNSHDRNHGTGKGQWGQSQSGSSSSGHWSSQWGSPSPPKRGWWVNRGTWEWWDWQDTTSSTTSGGTDYHQDHDHTDLMQRGGASSSMPSPAHSSDVAALSEGATEAPRKGIWKTVLDVTLSPCCSMWRKTSGVTWTRVLKKGKQRWAHQRSCAPPNAPTPPRSTLRANRGRRDPAVSGGATGNTSSTARGSEPR